MSTIYKPLGPNDKISTKSTLQNSFQTVAKMLRVCAHFPRVASYLQNIHGLMGLSDLDGLYII